MIYKAALRKNFFSTLFFQTRLVWFILHLAPFAAKNSGADKSAFSAMPENSLQASSYVCPNLSSNSAECEGWVCLLDLLCGKDCTEHCGGLWQCLWCWGVMLQCLSCAAEQFWGSREGVAKEGIQSRVLCGCHTQLSSVPFFFFPVKIILLLLLSKTKPFLMDTSRSFCLSQRDIWGCKPEQ